MLKLFVICVCPTSVDKRSFSKGEIVSSHEIATTANDRVTKLHKGVRGRSYNEARFAVIESGEQLEKGRHYPQLADDWIAARYDERATFTAKALINPTWQTGRTFDAETIAALLEDLKLDREALMARYGERAQRELDTDAADVLARAERSARIDAVSKEIALERGGVGHTFAAVQGIQAGRIFYASQVTYGELVTLFTFSDDTLPPELRAQRLLNVRRAEAIGQYVIDNPDTYVLPALTASVSAEMKFTPMGEGDLAQKMGTLTIPANAILLINDGQHRRSGVETALNARPALRNEAVTVTFFFDQGLERSQQIFADINSRQTKPASAISSLYDHRSPFNKWAVSVLAAMPQVRDRIDFEHASVAPKSDKLWSFTAFRKFLTLLTGVSGANVVKVEPEDLDQLRQFVAKFFDQCNVFIPYWRTMMEGRIPAPEIRQDKVIGHTVFLEALGMYAACVLFSGEERGGYTNDGVVQPILAHWDRLAALRKLDPARSAPVWDKRCVVLGKMQKTADGVKGTAALLVSLSDVALPLEMNRLEERRAA